MSRISGFVNVPVMPQSIGKIWRYQILIPSTTRCLESLVLSMFLWCHRALAKSGDLRFGILIPSTTRCLDSLVLSMFLVILEVWFCILDFGVWRFGRKKERKKEKKEKNNKEDKVHCLRGANPVLPQAEGPPRGNFRDFFFEFWNVMGNAMNGTERNKIDK